MSQEMQVEKQPAHGGPPEAGGHGSADGIYGEGRAFPAGHRASRTADDGRDGRSKAEQAFEVMRARYASGAAPLRDFLEIGRVSLDRRLELERLRREQDIMASELLNAVGLSAAGGETGHGETK